MAIRNRVNAAAGNAASAPAQGGRRPKLGQNFLADRGAAEKIVSALGQVLHTTVVEIGPGKGVLTSLLAARAQRLIAIELDRVLAAQLRLRFGARPNVEIIEGDILKIDLDTLLGPRPGALAGLAASPAAPTQVIGNIPYYITSDILLRMFEYHYLFQSMVIMVQKEVAERIAAKPGGKEYGLLSATSQLYAKVEKLFTLPPGAFAPPPKVQSTVLRLAMAPQFDKLGVTAGEFIDFLKLSFAQKRKTLVNNLKPRYAAEQVTAALKKSGVRTDARAETLSLEKAAAVFRTLQALGVRS
ncbi:MAG: 16S rRNA (adenine(1518)-N(6)/adenine(1519)-N(6))-dimethyltransferase RsmA [Terriglobales bacterium]